MNTINSIVEQINKDRQMTNERVSKIVAAIFEADDVDIMGVVLEDNNFYYKKEGSKEYFINKSDDDGEGFVLNFYIWDDDDVDKAFVRSITVTSIQDLYGAIATICKFDESPLEI